MNTNQTKECTCGCHTSESSSDDMKKNGCDLCYMYHEPSKECKQKEQNSLYSEEDVNKLDTILQEADYIYQYWYKVGFEDGKEVKFASTYKSSRSYLMGYEDGLSDGVKKTGTYNQGFKDGEKQVINKIEEWIKKQNKTVKASLWGYKLYSDDITKLLNTIK
jgi:hypothetical protein